MKRQTRTRTLTLLAMFSALAFVVMTVGRVPIVMWLKYDPKDVIITFAGLLFGPLSSLAVSLAVSLIEMVSVSDTGILGCVMNVLSTCSFACTAAFVYSRRRTLGGAVLGLVSGVLLMTAAMLLWNYLLTPLYMNQPREQVAALLVPVFLPFNLFKGSLNAALTLLLYKPLVQGLRRAKLIEAPEKTQAASGRSNPGGMLIAVAVLAAVCVVLLLVLKKML
ncbi:MAG: ECF transporter S component [Oscillospiraceae bacterium]|nr:ECF transporter S component [Oscillospiraceae bacterium]